MEQLESKRFQARMLRTCTQGTAAVLRAKDCVMKTTNVVQENAEDIYAEAKNINEERAAEMEEFSDADTAAETEEAENTEFNEVTE